MNLLRERESKGPNSGQDLENAGRMPDFLIIGAMKSGTTSLFELLGRHPRIFFPYWKEPQYFSRDHIFNRGEKWYRDNFIDAREDQIIGEGSTCYSRWPHYPLAAKRIAERLPNIRLIYIMRHPVERAYSHYGHLMQKRMINKDCEIMTFEEALQEEKEIIDASLYMMQIERYIPLFPRDQFLFLTFDELKSSPNSLLLRAQEFLGVKPIDLTNWGEVKANKWGEEFMMERVRELIYDIGRFPAASKIKYLMSKERRQRLKDMLIRSKLLSFLYKARLEGERKRLSPLTLKTRQGLLDKFNKPTSQLEKFMGWELPSWHN